MLSARPAHDVTGQAGASLEQNWSEPSFEQNWSEPSFEQNWSTVANGTNTSRSPGLSAGASLPASTAHAMAARFGHDFSDVRIHADEHADDRARELGAEAFTSGRDIAFARGRYAPETTAGARLLAHELSHVVQQTLATASGQRPASGVGDGHATTEREADVAADTALAGQTVAPLRAAPAAVQLKPKEPYISRVTVHLNPPETAELQWQGTPPATATGSDSFAVSTGKGYSDVGDDPGTCLRDCCTDPDTQCAPPWNKPSKVGACCTYVGNNFWTGKPEVEHNGWQWWTPIMPYYSTRGIALHQHTSVTGQPIGHGCVRMDEPNAKRIFDFSRGADTRVVIDGVASPVQCDDERRCQPKTPPVKGSGDGSNTPTTDGQAANDSVESDALAQNQTNAVEGLEGEAT